MKNKKSPFFTFCCSLVPGAGEMYMGLYKQGISLMILFFGVGAVGGWTGVELLWAFIPVIWFFSFFHTHNLRSMPEEEFLEEKDQYFLFQDFDMANADEFLKRNKKIIAIALIFWGACMLAQICMNLLDPFFGGFFWDLVWRMNGDMGRIIVAIAMLLCGFYLLKRRNEEVAEEEKKAEMLDEIIE
ncbi:MULTISPECIES: hypothetical protein [Anaerotignum]|uniref:hypothetical protein n=1 Tax=Anaerotignum TaxID=2039240 RepID=UPI002109E163|nr:MULTISPECIES: hypothetical protein [Anaerotignum]MCQ4936289.1 hypothetical protein [Anaerotignum propionicum]